jgi:hypothetical protein
MAEIILIKWQQKNVGTNNVGTNNIRIEYSMNKRC